MTAHKKIAKLIVSNGIVTGTNNRKESNLVHLLVCGDINLGICFKITFHHGKIWIICANERHLAEKEQHRLVHVPALTLQPAIDCKENKL